MTSPKVTIIKHQGKSLETGEHSLSPRARAAMYPQSNLKPVHMSREERAIHSEGDAAANQSKHGLSSPLSPNQS